MRDCLVIGSGRSGTSLLAGTLHAAGYFAGDDPIPPSDDNPKGFFEDRTVNAINEVLLSQVTAPAPAAGPEDEVRWNWRWLAPVPVGAALTCPPSQAEKIRSLVSRSPFCLKDPRFCYTLPIWRRFAPEAACLCVFREPARTARSIVKVCETGVYLHGLRLSFEEALELWMLMYRHVLDVHRHDGDWCFVHYDQLLDGSAAPRLEAMLGVPIPTEFADPRLKRSADEGSVSPEAREIYRALCELAGVTETVDA